MQKHIMNLMTLLGMLLGIVAIVTAINSYFILSMVFILVSVILTRINASLTIAYSPNTANTDYLNLVKDGISFVIAPALLLYVSELFFLSISLVFALLLYVLSGLYRLFRNHKEGTLIHAKGLPLTVGASLLIFIIAWFMYINQINLYSDVIMVSIVAFIAYSMSALPASKQ